MVNGGREVLLVYGPRELLNFDVYYSDGNGWKLTSPVNDKHNPREFVSTSLDSVLDSDGDGVNELSVSSRLYDGNTMVKTVRWSPEGYEVLGQRTVIAQQEPVRTTSRSTPTSASKTPETGLQPRETATVAPKAGAETRTERS